MDWNDLRYLLAVHRRGSLGSAAKELGVTKATMSRRLAALEEAVGARLLERRPNGVALTAAGHAAIATAEEMARASAELEARLASATDSAPRGTVRLTAPPWLASRFVIPELPVLKAQYPEVEVQLVGSERLLNLAQREADLAIRNVKPTHASLISRKVMELGGCVYGSTLYLDRKGRPAGRDALAGHDLLVYEGMGGMPGFEWMHAAPGGAQIAFRANGPHALLSAATVGLGLAAIPCLLGDAEPALERVLALGTGRCDLLLVSHEQDRNTQRVRVVADFLVEMLRRHRKEIDPFS